MLRFLDVSDQIDEDRPNFMFFDTRYNQVLCFGTARDHVFESVEDFVEAYNEEESQFDFNRLISIIPHNWFWGDMQEEDYKK